MRTDLLRPALNNHLHLLNSQRMHLLQMLEGTVQESKRTLILSAIEEKISGITDVQAMLNDLNQMPATINNAVKYLANG